MDQAYISTLSALAGTVVGGVTSFATSWVTQHSQARSARLAAERGAREELYGRFLDEVSRVYAHAISEEVVDYRKLIDIFALRGRIALRSSPPVIACANTAVKVLTTMYMAPNRSPQEVFASLEDASIDPLSDFAATCRKELDALR